MVDFTRLHHTSVTLTSTLTAVTPEPNFKCPNCNQVWQPSTSIPAPVNSTTNFNQKIVFLCPQCNSRFTVWVAVHRDPTLTALCIQKSSEEGTGGIPVNWWVTE